MTTSLITLVAVTCFSVDPGLPVPDLDLVKSSYLEATTSIHSLDCRYEVHKKFSKSLQEILTDRSNAVEKVRLLRSGSKRAMAKEYFGPKGDHVTSIWHGYDGKSYASWRKSFGKPEQIRHLPSGRISKDLDVHLFDIQSIDRFLGEGLRSGFINLKDLLQKPDDLKIIGWESFQDRSLLRIDFIGHAAAPNSPRQMDTTVWLDPGFRYLPRRIEQREHVKGGDIVDTARRPADATYEVQEFTVVRGHDSRSYLFPKTGFFKNKTVESQVKLVSVIINAPMAPSAFTPEFPDLTEIEELLPDGQKKKSYIGNKADRDKKLQEIYDREL